MKYLTIASLAFLVVSSSAFSQNAPPGNPVNTGFMAQQPNDRLASRLVGLSIQNNGNETIGDIDDIVLTDAGAVKAYVVSVGGFLGMGTKYVAIDPKAVMLPRQDEKTWKATMNATKDQLKAAPEYKNSRLPLNTSMSPNGESGSFCLREHQSHRALAWRLRMAQSHFVPHAVGVSRSLDGAILPLSERCKIAIVQRDLAA